MNKQKFCINIKLDYQKPVLCIVDGFNEDIITKSICLKDPPADGNFFNDESNIDL